MSVEAIKSAIPHREPFLLIDEIDRADAEFEAFLLEVLSDFQVSVPDLGTLVAKHMPIVLLTSNNTRELSEALKRRCLYLFIGYPSMEQELSVVRMKVPQLAPKLAQQAVDLVQRLRGMDLRKSPSISETLDWAKSLVALNARQLDREVLENTLSVLLKHESDLQKVKRRLDVTELAPEPLALLERGVGRAVAPGDERAGRPAVSAGAPANLSRRSPAMRA